MLSSREGRLEIANSPTTGPYVEILEIFKMFEKSLFWGFRVFLSAKNVFFSKFWSRNMFKGLFVSFQILTIFQIRRPIDKRATKKVRKIGFLTKFRKMSKKTV